MKRRKLVYEQLGKGGGIFQVYVLPKHLRPKGVDGIQIIWASCDEIQQGKPVNAVHIKDWEALCLIEGLTAALLAKKLGPRTKVARFIQSKKTRKNWVNKLLSNRTRPSLFRQNMPIRASFKKILSSIRKRCQIFKGGTFNNGYYRNNT